MTWYDMKFCLVLYWAFIQSNHVHIDYKLCNMFEWTGNAGQASLNFLALNLSDQQRNSVALFCRIKRFSEHLYRLYFSFLLDLTHLDLITNFYPSLNHCSCHNVTLSLDFEAMINHKQEIFVYFFSFWKLLQIVNDCLFHSWYVFEHILFRRNWYH